MEQEITLEQAREVIALLEFSFAKLDQATTQIIETRWQYELLTANPELSRGKAVPNDLAKAVVDLAKERTAAEQVCRTLTGNATLDTARETYRELVAVFTEIGRLDEILIGSQHNISEQVQEAQKVKDTANGNVYDERQKYIETLAALIRGLGVQDVTDVTVSPIVTLR